MKILLQFHRQFFIAVFLAFLLQACASTPETPREIVATAEIGYQEALDTATRWINEGRVTADEKEKLTNAADAYESTRNAARASISAYDTVAGGGSLADLDVAELSRLLGVSPQDLEAAQAAGDLVQLLSGEAEDKSRAVRLALINLRTVLSEVE